MTRLQLETFRLPSSVQQRSYYSTVSDDILSAFQLNSCNRIRFRQQSRCIRGALRRIRDALGTFTQDSKWLAISILPRMRSECVKCCWNAVRIFRMQSECSSNALTMPSDRPIFSLRMHSESFEHEQNIPASDKNELEYFVCTQNAFRMFRMQFDCQRMHNECLFRWHSGSFQY